MSKVRGALPSRLVGEKTIHGLMPNACISFRSVVLSSQTVPRHSTARPA